MLTEQEIESIHDNLWVHIQDICLGITLTGSKSLPFINNSKDIDLILWVKNEDDRTKLRYRVFYDFEDLNKTTMKELYNFCLRVSVINSEDACAKGRSWWLYTIEYNKRIYGENLSYTDPSILLDINAFKCSLRRDILTSRVRLALKWWYSIFVSLCIIKNKCLDFTPEQIETINKLHDAAYEENSDIRDLVKYCLSELDISIEEFIENVPTYKEYFETNKLLTYKEIKKITK